MRRSEGLLNRRIARQRHLAGPVACARRSIGSDQCNGEHIRPPLRDLQCMSCFRADTIIRDRVSQPLQAAEPPEDLRPAHLPRPRGREVLQL